MQVTRIAPVNKDNRIKYIPLEEASMPVITKGENYIGSVRIEPSVACKHHCYLGLSLDSNGQLSYYTHCNLNDVYICTCTYIIKLILFILLQLVNSG